MTAPDRPVFPLRAIAALFIERQHLDRPRSRKLTAKSLARLTEDTGGLQLDSINVLERAHYLTAWSRFGPYDRQTLDRLVYGERVLLEYWAHAACLIPASHLAWWRRAMLDYQPRHTGWSRFLKRYPTLIAAVENEIRTRGPLANADFKHERPRSRTGWWSWKPAAHALHHLWMTGRVSVHSRVHFQKRFDLTERVLPRVIDLDAPATDAFYRWHLRQSLHAMGAATETDLRMYFTFPRFGTAARRQTLAAMVESGEVLEIGVEGDSAHTRWLVLADDLPALARAARKRMPAQGTTLLSPFDSFLWHRERTRRLFGFNYRIEVYTPGDKRIHGYYSLPIFHDGQLIGRLDAKHHRAERRLEARSVHFERWFARGQAPPGARWGPHDRDQAMAGLAEAIGSLALFVGAERVELGRATPSRLGGALRLLLKGAPASSGRMPAV
jgi:hypothetical protein